MFSQIGLRFFKLKTRSVISQALSIFCSPQNTELLQRNSIDSTLGSSSLLSASSRHFLRSTFSSSRTGTRQTTGSLRFSELGFSKVDQCFSSHLDRWNARRRFGRRKEIESKRSSLFWSYQGSFRIESSFNCPSETQMSSFERPGSCHEEQ